MTPSARFLRSLGDLAPASERRVAGPDVRADALLLRGEGGILHHRNASPDDARLDAWADALLTAEAREAAGRAGLVRGPVTPAAGGQASPTVVAKP